MLEITGDDIAALGDEDLRTLVGLLCEAEMRRRKLPVSAVTWGGNQTAKDGGLDGRVALAAGTIIDGFVPRPDTGFQVKKSDMPRQAILKEMKPKGELRPAIRELADASGAYIIVSSAGSTSDSALKDRRSAMSEAVQALPNSANLTLDFYDRNRIATWVREHGGLVLWVRSRISRSLPGWRAYGSWSRTPEGADTAYLQDEAARIRTGDKDEGDGLSATDGINKIRDVLRAPGRVVRLVGLSGVGKTRLAEALFDSAVGVDSLDPALAIYTDVADGPSPQPVGLASDLIAARTRAILVVDNCPPDTDRRLAELASSTGTTVSVITIEYDIREDQPEGTDVFALETSSEALIERLVSNRFPGLSQIDCRTIAEFSGGNARVALALAATVPKNETVAGLSDAELFRRLFEQRNEPDSSLRVVAEVCSLVYSFDGESRSGEHAELPVLCELIGKSTDDVYRGLAELKRRDLLQQRGPWRAVLPHAIANRLAATALQNLPTESVLDRLENSPPRLLRSFSRRLGYLDASKEARTIVRRWFGRGGLLADLINLNELGRAMFDNVAPVVPETVLAALEEALGDIDDDALRKCEHFIPVLRSLAYEEVHFERVVSLLLKFARLPHPDGSKNGAIDVIASLFYIVVSGTHAPLDLRLKVVKTLLSSAESSAQEMGARALQALLKTDGFSPPHTFEFGARSRDYGYHPKTPDDVRAWFSTVLRFAERLALSDSTEGELVRTALAHEFRGLWTDSGQVDRLERLSRAIAAKQFWREGWISARQTRVYDGKRLSADVLARLSALEEALRPKDLFDRVRGLVLGSRGGRFDVDDYDDVEERDYAAAAAPATAAAEQLGRDVALDERMFEALLPELLAGGGKVADFGRGLALGAEEPTRLWNLIVERLATMKVTRVDLLGGFLEGLQICDVSLAHTLLDRALDDPTLAAWLPVLQTSVGIDERALRRLHATLERGGAPIERFFAWAYGRRSEAISGRDFKQLVLTIAGKPDGMPVAMEILSMRLHSDEAAKRPPLPEVIELGKALVTEYKFHRPDGRTREDYELGRIIRACLRDEDGSRIARRLCRDVVEGNARHELYAHHYGDALSSLFRIHPAAMLDELFSGDPVSQRDGIRLLRNLTQFRMNPIGGVADDVIIGWCDTDPAIRYPIAAAVTLLFKRPTEKAPHEWTNLASQLLAKAPDPEAVFKEVVARLRPSSWSGSRATKLETRLHLLAQLDISTIPALQPAFAAAKATLKAQIEEERQREMEEDSARSGRFE